MLLKTLRLKKKLIYLLNFKHCFKSGMFLKKLFFNGTFNFNLFQK